MGEKLFHLDKKTKQQHKNKTTTDTQAKCAHHICFCNLACGELADDDDDGVSHGDTFRGSNLTRRDVEEEVGSA